MSKELILIRHAKSAWDDPAADDHDRVLNKRGRKAAKAIGEWLRVHEFFVDTAMVSTAARAAETWDRISPVVGENAKRHDVSELYLAAPRTVLDVLRRAEGRRVALIGHNPGMAMFAAGICNSPSLHPDFNRYPTCATTVLRFNVASWKDVDAGMGELLDFIVPRQLLG